MAGEFDKRQPQSAGADAKLPKRSAIDYIQRGGLLQDVAEGKSPSLQFNEKNPISHPDIRNIRAALNTQIMAPNNPLLINGEKYARLELTNIFDKNLKDALAAYQAANGLPSTGNFGKLTCTKLFPHLVNLQNRENDATMKSLSLSPFQISQFRSRINSLTRVAETYSAPALEDYTRRPHLPLSKDQMKRFEKGEKFDCAVGITLGVGWDIGNFRDIKSDADRLQAQNECRTMLQKAGVQLTPDWEVFIGAAGLKGKDAYNYFTDKNNRAAFDKLVLNEDQEKKLFTMTRSELERETIEKYNEWCRVKGPRNVPVPSWQSLPAPARELLFDLRYRGDYGRVARAALLPDLVSGRYEEFYRKFNNKGFWCSGFMGVPESRFKLRAAYATAQLENIHFAKTLSAPGPGNERLASK